MFYDIPGHERGEDLSSFPMVEVAKMGSAWNLSEHGSLVPIVLAGDGNDAKFIQAVPDHDENTRFAAISAAIYNARKQSGSDHICLVLDVFAKTLEDGEKPQVSPKDDPTAEDAILIIEAKGGATLSSSMLNYHRDDRGKIRFDPEGWCELDSDSMQGMLQMWVSAMSGMDLSPMRDAILEAYPDIEALAYNRVDPRMN